MTEQPDPTTGPYGSAAMTYWRSGWAPLPLPPRAKKHPPEGYTGNTGAWPSGADVHAWTEDHPGGNIALRLPPGVIGLDVDAYGQKAGGLVLAQLQEQLGELPPTWRSTSRDVGVSGIRLYTIPESLRWPGILGPGIEVLRHGHRYAVAWPSIHPDTGGTYRWITPETTTALHDIPTPDDLPALPEEWVQHFTGGEVATTEARADLNDRGATDWLTGRTTGTPCRHMTKALRDSLPGLTAATSRHDHTLALTNRLIWLAGQGHTGIDTALTQASAAFTAAVGTDRDEREATSEWDRMIVGAIRISAAAHPATPPPDPCDDPFTGLIAPTLKEKPCQTPTSTTSADAPPQKTSTASPTPSNGSSTSTPTPQQQQPSAPNESSSGTTSTDPDPTTPSGEVFSRLQLGGHFILDIPDRIPAIWGRGEEVLWAEGEALTLCGPAGVGKTTLTGQIVRCRIVGGDVLGYPIAPTTSKILYLAMDRPRQIARALRRTLGDLPRETLDERLIVWPGPPIADIAAHPETLLGLVQLAGADTVIIDSLKDAAIGLSNDEVGAGYNRARQMCTAAGIEVLEQHHMVKKGENGSLPNSLADMYGSVWIASGSGSVVLLYGAAGDPIVSMRHLKSPAEEVGPYRLIHDHSAGHTDIWHQSDLVEMARLAGTNGISARQVACQVEEKENPDKAATEKMRRKLDKLAEQGLLTRVDGGRGGGNDRAPATWFYVPQIIGKATQEGSESNHAQSRKSHNRRSGNHGVSTPQTSHEPITPITEEYITAGQAITEPITAITEGGNHGRTPLYKGGVRPYEGLQGQTERPGRKTPIAGGTAYYDHHTGEVLEP